ncbi:MAG TPA: phosphoribosylaminoimidazolesuccinocarboxamide synthase [Thermoanaerobaculia bacterium]|nr:phosphoribosylaminoimidazolesuccinocarboxamide synthase [Thermoanaerobaculia bacterium]
MKPLAATALPFPLLRRGKVRDVYDLGDTLLIVATDRVSAFDVVLSPGIPDKGKVLNQLSNFWFSEFPDVENHLVETDARRFPEGARGDDLPGRAVIARKCAVVPFECVARGYLAGSGWKDYARTGEICGVRLPPGLREASRLPEPIFTPATKAESGHDENVPLSRLAEVLGAERARELSDRTIALYREVARRCEEKGILLADSKIEFGVRDGRLVWIDEAFTPDSSRFWPAGSWRPGISPPSLDKQFIRDWLEGTGWNKTPPAPELPGPIVRGTRDRYLEAFRKITGRNPEFVEI